jgi:dynein heavy chain
MSDLQVSVMQLHQFTNAYPDVPFTALTYLTGECNYGGRVTDERDRRVLKSLLQDFYSESALLDDFMPNGLAEYKFPSGGLPLQGYLDCI